MLDREQRTYSALAVARAKHPPHHLWSVSCSLTEHLLVGSNRQVLCAIVTTCHDENPGASNKKGRICFS